MRYIILHYFLWKCVIDSVCDEEYLVGLKEMLQFYFKIPFSSFACCLSRNTEKRFLWAEGGMLSNLFSLFPAMFNFVNL